MLQQHQAVSGRSAHALTVSLAHDAGEVYQAQRLRYKVFAEEMGARLSSSEPGIDSDIYKPFCEHVIVREPQSGRVLGTYRLLNGANARKLGGCYSDDEFDLTRLDHLRDDMVEVGRFCASRLSQRRRHHATVDGSRAIYGAARLPLFDRLCECEHGRRRCLGIECSLCTAKLLRQPGRVPRVSAAGFAAAPCVSHRRGANSAADQGLRAAGRLCVRRAGVGSGF